MQLIVVHRQCKQRGIQPSFAQALQQVQRAAYAVMAGAQHLERLVKARAWRVQTG